MERGGGGGIREFVRRGHHGILGLLLWAGTFLLAFLQVEPVPIYFYVLTWYPALLVIDAMVLRRKGTSLLSAHPLSFLCLMSWSIPFWLLFESINLRIENWYYVNAPNDLLASRLFLLLSFATVLPGLMEAFDLFRSYGIFKTARCKPVRVGIRGRTIMVLLGAICLVLMIARPNLFYPLAWIFLLFLLEPFNLRPGWPSLLGDLRRGKLDRLGQLLAAGFACGLYWELMNLLARTRWIYTVPFFDQTLGVEMPPLGFLGFLPFALEAYAFIRLVEILGLSVSFEKHPGERHIPQIPLTVRVLLIPPVLAVSCFIVVLQMEKRTVDSLSPRVADLSSASPRESAILSLDGISHVSELLKKMSPEKIAHTLDASPLRVRQLLDEAQLAHLRGIGSRNAQLLLLVGVGSVKDLARQDPEQLFNRLRDLGPSAETLRPQRVRIWVLGARSVSG